MSSVLLGDRPEERRTRLAKRPWLSRHEQLLLGLCGLVPLLVVWQIGGMVLTDKTFISSPVEIALAARGQIASGQLLSDFFASMSELFPGFGLAALVGVPLGMMIGRSRYVEYALDPYIWFFYSAPIIAFYPLLIMWFGLGARTVVVLTFTFAFFPIVSNTITAVQTVDRVLIRAARAFGADRLQIMWLVIFPASIPTITAGLRLGIGRALIGTVVGEFFGANAGLGYRIALYGTEMNIGNMFVPVIVVMAIGVLLLQLLQRFENSVASWRG